ncbi:hypothetical protein MKW98_015024 [Papaver atlanticum]|uniref:Uncharacterized protein n=1 Tax=Papaver atlanticum TaxID=357466 RepID=A0AAD4S7Q7_9MAGN|nr:hypothetical protein MKW98_015024 [Papaver atlanticum]
MEVVMLCGMEATSRRDGSWRRNDWVAVVDGGSRLKLLVVTVLIFSCRARRIFLPGYGGLSSTSAKLHSKCLRNVPKETMMPMLRWKKISGEALRNT